ncbi:MAG TPA: hypothetical protein VNW06_11355 [Cytophagaceae bacterium]|nr:hypothetical protein [Cytophagaceae bacterium]
MSTTPAHKTSETIKLFLNGKEVKDKISLKATGKIEVILPEGWRYISGKIKILQGDEVKKSQQVAGEKELKEFDLLQFIKLNAVSGNHVSLELSVRTKESGTLSMIKLPIE